MEVKHPKTRLGQGVTIIFCTFGIPMTMLAMKSLGELLAIGVRSLVIKTETILLNRTEPRHVKLNTICVSGCIIVFQHVMLASLSTSFTANWSFLESFYAWFITLSIYDRFWWLCAFEKVFERNRCRKNVEIASYIIYGSLFPAICDEPQFLFVYFIAPGRFHGSNSTNAWSLYELLS